MTYLNRIDRDFNLWREKNPQIWDAIETAAYALGQKLDRFGLKMVFEHVRYTYALDWGGEFKLPNEYTPYAARYLVRKYPWMKSKIRFKGVKRDAIGCQMSLYS